MNIVYNYNLRDSCIPEVIIRQRSLYSAGLISSFFVRNMRRRLIWMWCEHD